MRSKRPRSSIPARNGARVRPLSAAATETTTRKNLHEPWNQFSHEISRQHLNIIDLTEEKLGGALPPSSSKRRQRLDE